MARCVLSFHVTAERSAPQVVAAERPSGTSTSEFWLQLGSDPIRSFKVPDHLHQILRNAGMHKAGIHIYSLLRA
jgi:hypothetical protein